MPEGQAIHRLARIASGFLAGRIVAASSPQGRFAEGAARLDGLTAFRAQAWGKHFFMPFAESGASTAEPSLGDDGPAWLHVHLGLYGRWSFSGPRATDVAGAGLRGGGNAAAVPEPGATVRLRLEAEGLAADLTGPARCEVLDGQGVRRGGRGDVVDRRADAGVEGYALESVHVRSSRGGLLAVGTLLATELVQSLSERVDLRFRRFNS